MLQVQELIMIGIVGAVVVFHIVMFARLWRKDYSLPTKLAWSVAIVSLPVAGASLYYWFNEC